MSPRQIKRINAWRAQFNPLRGLTLQRAVTLLEDGERGAYADLQWTYRFIEKRDATLRGLVQLRTSAIKKLDWDIKLSAAATAKGADPAQKARAEAQAKVLRTAYESIRNLKEAVAALALAEFRGFAHLEKRYANDNPAQPIVSLDPVPQWHWVRDTSYGEWQYNADAASGNYRGEPIDPAHFIIREVAAPINEIGLICFLRKNLSQKDWDGFVEVYGIPPLFIEMPAQTPPDKESEYQSMAEAVIGDMRGTLPNGAKVQTAGGEARGVNPFRDHLTYQDEQLVLAGTSGKLTMLNGPTGLGSGQSDAHADTFDSLAQAEAGEISELLQLAIDRPALAAAGLGEGPALAYFELAATDQTDVGQLLDHAVKAKGAGLQVDAAEMAEKTSLKLTLAPVAPAAPGGFGGEPLPTFNRATPAASAPASFDEQLAAALAVPDEAGRRAALRALSAALPATLRTVPPGDPAARLLEAGMAEAMVRGAAAAFKKLPAAKS